MWLMEICASSLTAWTLTSKKVWQRSWTEHHPKSLRSWRTYALATLSNLTHGHFAQHTWILPMHTFQDPQIVAFPSCKSSLVIQNEVVCNLLWVDTSLRGNLQEATRPCKCLTLTTCDASTCFQVCEHLAAAWTGMTHILFHGSVAENLSGFCHLYSTETMHAAPQRHVTWKHDKAVVSLNIEQ